MNIGHGIALGASIVGGTALGGYVGDQLMGDIHKGDDIGTTTMGLATLTVGVAGIAGGGGLIVNAGKAGAVVGAGLVAAGLTSMIVGCSAPVRNGPGDI